MYRSLWALVLVPVLVSLAPHPAGSAPLHGLYLDSDWLVTQPSESALATLHSRLAAAGVRDLYIQIRDVKSPMLSPQTARLMAALRTQNSALRLIPFLGRRVCAEPGAGSCFDLRSESDPRRLQAQVQQLFQLGYDGVQLDLEPVGSGDAGFLALLHAIGRNKPAGKLLSVAGYMFEPSAEILARVRPSPRGGATPLYWSRDYYREVLRRADSVVMMNYDTGIQSPAEYRQWTRYQLGELLALQRSVGGKLIQLGIPAYKNGRRGLFNSQAESALVALSAWREVLADLCPAPVGLTPYHESEMSPEIWNALASDVASAAQRCRLPAP